MDTRLSQIERDLASITTIISRYDVTIEKLAEVSSTVSKLLAVQDKRLEVTERNVEKLESTTEKTKEESTLLVAKLNEDFATLLANVSEQIGDRDKEVSEKLDKMIAENKTDIEKLEAKHAEDKKGLEERISKVERYMWMATGVVSIVVILISVGARFIPT